MSGKFSSSVDPSLTSTMQGGFDQGGGISLPYPAPVAWIANGDSKNKRLADQSPVEYFGGWMIDTANVLDAIKDFGYPPFPLESQERISRSGDTYQAYDVRVLYFAPFALRTTWLTRAGQDGGGSQRRSGNYDAGAGFVSRHVQVLVYTAFPDSKGVLVPWGPMVLSAKGYQGGNLANVIGKARSHLVKILRTIDPEATPNMFYIGVGTFGERKQVMVGKEGSKSPICTIETDITGQVDDAFLEKRFVGLEVFQTMGELYLQSQEWLNAYRNPVADEAQSSEEVPF